MLLALTPPRVPLRNAARALMPRAAAAALLCCGGTGRRSLSERRARRHPSACTTLPSQALQLVGKLAKAMGRAIGREARCVVGPAFKCLTDNKAMVSRQGRGVEMARAAKRVRLHAQLGAQALAGSAMQTPCMSCPAAVMTPSPCQVRAAVIEMAEAWAAVAPPELLFEEAAEVSRAAGETCSGGLLQILDQLAVRSH